jgi:hypothetical protein
MADTFESCWRKVLLFAPEVPVFLAREFVQQAFERVSESRPWGHLRKDAVLTTKASRSVTVTATLGSTTLTSSGGFLATDIGRQVKVTGASVPLYTVNTFTSVNEIDLLETYAGATGSVVVTILDAYLVLPMDFGRFETVVDPSNQRILPFWLTREELDWHDPHRTSSGDPARCLVPRGYSEVTSLAGRPLYEWWPQPTAARTYPALYFTRPPVLTDTQTLPGCAAWPGTRDKPNPYFNLALHNAKLAAFRADVLQLSLRDDDRMPMDLPQMPWETYRSWGLAMDTNLLRTSDATTLSYY